MVERLHLLNELDREVLYFIMRDSSFALSLLIKLVLNTKIKHKLPRKSEPIFSNSPYDLVKNMVYSKKIGFDCSSVQGIFS